MTFDEARAAFPRLQFAVHAYDPGGDVTLEMIADGDVFTFTGETLQIALDRAFPAPAAAVDVAEPANVFD